MGNGLKKEESAALKGVAILLMIFHHCYRSEDRIAAHPELIFDPFQAGQILQIGLYCKICVCIFAFVSGYGLLYGYRKNQQNSLRITDAGWVKRHLLSTLSGFWFISFLSCILLGITGRINIERWGNTRVKVFLGIFSDCLGLSGLFDGKTLNGSWWYMGAAVTFIVLLPILAAGIKRFGGFVCMALIFLLPRVLKIGFLGGRSPYSFLAVFALGAIFCEYDLFQRFEMLKVVKNEKLNEGIRFVILLLWVLAGIWSYKRVPISQYWEYQFVWIPTGVILFCKGYLFRIGFLKKILQYLGKHSMNIWLVHTFVRDHLKAYVWSARYFLLVPLVILLISLVISYAVDILKKYSGYDHLVQVCKEKMK